MHHRLTLTTLLTAALFVGVNAAAEEKDEHLTADQVPKAVMATLEKAAAGAKLGDFEREEKHGKTVYTAEIPGKDAGTVIEFTVAEDGTLLKQETEKDDHADGDKDDDKDEKGEHKGKHGKDD